MEKIVIILLTLFGWTGMISGPTGHNKPDGCTHVDNNKDSFAAIQFRMVFGLITVQTEINGIEGYLFLDTGIEGLILNGRHFAGSRSDLRVISTSGRTVKAERLHANVSFANRAYTFPHARVVNIDHIVRNPGTRVLGIVGWDVFHGFEVQVDMAQHILRLYPVDPAGKVMSEIQTESPPLTTLDLHFNKSFPYIEARLGEKKLQLILDTGSTINVISGRLYKKLEKHTEFMHATRMLEWHQNGNEVPVTRVFDLRLDTIPLDTMRTAWCPLGALNAELDAPHLDGTLGLPLMRKYLLSINFQARKVTFYDYPKSIKNSP